MDEKIIEIRKKLLKKQFCKTHIFCCYEGTYVCKTKDSASDKQCNNCKVIDILLKPTITEEEFIYIGKVRK